VIGYKRWVLTENDYQEYERVVERIREKIRSRSS